MRLHLPPVFPTYLLLALVIVFAIASAWLGIVRLAMIEDLDASSARSAATAHNLQALQNAVIDIEASGRGFVLTGDAADLERYDRARQDIPVLLASLRDHVRRDADALTLVESLVPLIARRTALTSAAIDQRRGSNERPPPPPGALAGKESTDAIRAVVATLEARGQEQLARDRGMLLAAIDGARRDRYLLATVIVLLAALLFLAVRRLKAFIPPRLQTAPAEPARARASGGRLAMVLQDALLRARIAAADASSTAAERVGTLVTSMEQARDAQAQLAAEWQQPLPVGDGLAPALARLAQSYARPNGPAVNAAADRAVTLKGRDACFLVYRAAEWALETVAARKRSGEITLHFTAGNGEASLRITALPDKPNVPLQLTPSESDEAGVIHHAANALGGNFAVAHGVTGFSLLLTLPLGR